MMLRKKIEITQNAMILKDKIDFAIIFILIIIFSLTWINISLFNLLSRFNLIIILAALICIYLNHINEISLGKFDFWVLFIAIPILLVNKIINQSNIGSFLVIITLFLILLTSRYIKIKEQMIVNISWYIFFYSLIWNMIPHRGFNANTIGLVSLFLIINSSFILEKNDKTYKTYAIYLFFLFLTFRSVVTIIESDSRGALWSLVFFFVIRFLIPKKILAKKSVFNIVLFVLTFGSLIFVYVYIFLWRNNINIHLPFTNKSLFTGREAIWYETIHLFDYSRIVGLGSNFMLDSFNEINLHNSVFNLLIIYGIPIFILFMYYLFSTITRVRKNVSTNKITFTSFAGLCAILLNGYFETTLLFVNNLPIIFLLFVFLSSYNNVITNRQSRELQI